MTVKRVRDIDASLTSRAQCMVFFVSDDLPRFLRNSLAIHSSSKSCLISPEGKQSAESPRRPKHSRTVESDVSASARQRWISSRMVGKHGKRSPTYKGSSLDASGSTHPWVLTFICVLETSYNARIGFQDALAKLSNVIYKIKVKLVPIKTLKHG